MSAEVLAITHPTLISIENENGGSMAFDDEWPADPDEVPEWRLRQEWRAAAIGISLPNYRTRREYESSVELCRQVLAAEEAARNSAVYIQPPLPARESAFQFLAWLRETGNCGSIASDQLSDLYASHCRHMGRAPSPENSMRGALLRLPGVTKRLADQSTASGVRHRPTYWEIAASTENLAVRLAVAV